MPRRDETFLVYYWEDFQEYLSDNPSCFYCLSESTVQIALSALRFSGWPTRWRLNREDNSRRLSDPAIWNEIEALSALAQRELITDMSCDLQAGFETLATAIQNASNKDAIALLAGSVSKLADQQCCDGQSNLATNGGIVGTYQDADDVTRPIYGSEDLYELPIEGFPPEFESEEAYLLNKCQMANLVFDGWLLTMRGLGALTVFNATALAGLIGAAFAGIIIFPPAAIPVMIAALLAAAGFLAMFVDICNELEANRTEIICDLYNSDTVEQMTQALGEALDDAIGLLVVAAPIATALKTIALLVVNGDTLNQVLHGVAGLSYPDADCSGCGPSPFKQQTEYNQAWEEWEETIMEIDQVEDFPSYAFGTPPSTQWQYVVIDFGRLVNVSFVHTGHTAPADFGASAFRAGTSFGGNYAGETNIYNSNTPPDTLEGVGNIAFVSGYLSSYSLQITLDGLSE